MLFELKNINELCCIFGFINWFWKFILNYFVVVNLLNKFFKFNIKYNWIDE